MSSPLYFISFDKNKYNNKYWLLSILNHSLVYFILSEGKIKYILKRVWLNSLSLYDSFKNYMLLYMLSLYFKYGLQNLLSHKYFDIRWTINFPRVQICLDASRFSYGFRDCGQISLQTQCHLLEGPWDKIHALYIIVVTIMLYPSNSS